MRPTMQHASTSQTVSLLDSKPRFTMILQKYALESKGQHGSGVILWEYYPELMTVKQPPWPASAEESNSEPTEEVPGTMPVTSLTPVL